MNVQVIVDVPNAQVNRPFDYCVPNTLASVVQLGQRVQVPFGNRQLLGFIVGISEQSHYDKPLKEITTIMDYESFLNEELLMLSEFLAQKLYAFRISVLQAMLPSMLKAKYSQWIIIHDKEVIESMLGNDNFEVGDKVEKEIFEQLFTRKQIKQWLDEGIIHVEYHVDDQTTTKYVTHIKCELSNEQLEESMRTLDKRSAKLKQLLAYIQAHSDETWTYAQLTNKSGVSQSTIKTAISKGLLVTFQQEVYRDPYRHYHFDSTQKRQLKSQQQEVYESVSQAILQRKAESFLLEGVTGSGKTEVYLQLLEEARHQGRTGLLLVPEIALTPQMVQQVKGRFQDGVAVLHSGLSKSEKYDEWRRIMTGEATIVVGARSSIFAPLLNLGVIIIDEEHEATYKQSDMPRYHARDVALWRSDYHQCPVVLGSATPSLESRARAQVGKYTHLKLTERVNQSPLPPVMVVDMSKQMVTQTHDEISSILQQKIAQRLTQKQQVVLLLNRRGYATYVQCRECGYVFQCPKCDISLTHHKTERRLKCHYCDFYLGEPEQCSQCHSRYVRGYGLGTQKVMETLERLFPTARIIRMDVDTTKKKGDHERLFKQFADHEADILLGTQMIAKGLDFEKVTLVGIINADTSLNLPDFRASERTFQLLTQVAGRTGRGRFKGEVVLQTYNPDHYAIQLAQQHDYEKFFYYEMKRRHMGHYPPYYYTTLITVSSKNRGYALQQIYDIKAMLHEQDGTTKQDMMVIGPSQSHLAKINEVYYYRLLLKYKDEATVTTRLQEILTLSQKTSQRGVYVAIDHEPLSFV